MGCCDQPEEPCVASTECPVCHTVQSWELDYTPTVVHIGSFPVAGQSVVYDIAETHTCTNHPYVHVVSRGNAVSNVGAVQTSNPYAIASPDNATGDSSEQLRS